MLKTNSRFACLVENLGPNRDKRRNTPPNRERYPNKNTKTNLFQKKIGYEMDINNFPTLSSTPNISTTDNIDINESYIENLTKPVKQSNVLTFEELNPGWISINGSSRIIHKSKSISKSISKSGKAPFEPRYIDMVNRINTNYVNYKENYIELWGQEEYEHMFLFPNYNYCEYDYYTDDEEEDDEEEYDEEY
uniref:Uncharacterized protein n=1 Tax=viral metagenome TaxID=1070528 RepID=A0A6C0LJL6_9ZZZZ